MPPGTTRAVILEGAERVVWRAADGAVQLWEDRCPHRGMRLSLGFVRGNALNCLYHGWEFGAAGPCARIPAHPDLVVPGTIRATAFPVREAGAMIWTSPGEETALAVPEALPLASLAIDAPADALLDALGIAPPTGAQLVSASLDGIALELGWHVAGPARTMLHAAAVAPVDTGRALGALRALRTKLEHRRAA